MTQLNLDYLAGFFDGEGNVSMFLDNRTNMVRCRLSIFNTNKEVIDLLKAQYGGFISTMTNERPDGSMKHYRKSHWKTSYTLIIQLSKKHINFIEELASRSIVKKEKLLLALEFLKTIGDRGTRGIKRDSRVEEQRRLMIHLMNDNRNRAGTTTKRSDSLTADAIV